MIDINSTVHHAVQSAIDKAVPQDMTTFSFKAQKEYIEVAHQICDRHGITLGAFLRECVVLLVDDYMPPQKSSKKAKSDN